MSRSLSWIPEELQALRQGDLGRTRRTTAGHGAWVEFEDGARIVYRLSGTGTEGATLRIYMERYEADPRRQAADPQVALAPVIAAAAEIAGLSGFGVGRPTGVT